MRPLERLFLGSLHAADCWQQGFLPKAKAMTPAPHCHSEIQSGLSHRSNSLSGLFHWLQLVTVCTLLGLGKARSVCYLLPDATCLTISEWQPTGTPRSQSEWTSAVTFSIRESSKFKNCGVFLKDWDTSNSQSITPLVHNVRCTKGATLDRALSWYTGCQSVVSNYNCAGTFPCANHKARITFDQGNCALALGQQLAHSFCKGVQILSPSPLQRLGTRHLT